MALAAFKLLKCTGTDAAVETDSAKVIGLLSADIVSVDTAVYYIGAPIASGEITRSYEDWMRQEMTAAPDNYCQTFKIFGPSTQPDYLDTPGDQMTIMLGTTDSGVTPVDTASSVATVSQHDNYYSVATGLSVGVEPSDGVIDTIGQKTDYVVAQLKVEFDVQQGDMTAFAMQWSYEEV
jgi:hypothetical protein